MNIKTLLLATVAATAATAAHAADPILPAPVVPVAPIASAFGWDGLYAGLRLGAQNEVSFDTNFLLGVEIGANAVFDMFVLGGELGLDAVFASPDTYAYGEITVRGGVLLTDQVLVYATAGFGTDFDAALGSGDHVLAGLGAEFALTENVSLDARYVYGWEQSGAATASDIHKFTIGANFHF